MAWQSRLMARHRGQGLIKRLNVLFPHSKFYWDGDNVGRVAGLLPSQQTEENMDSRVDWYLAGFSDGVDLAISRSREL